MFIFSFICICFSFVLVKLELLAKGAFQGRFLEEYQSLRSRRLELGSPNLLWMIGPGIFIQVLRLLVTSTCNSTVIYVVLSYR